MPLWLGDIRIMSYCVETDCVSISLSVNNLWLAGELVCFGVLHMLWMLSKFANIWDDMNNLNFPLNLGNEITPTVRLMNSVFRHPNKYLLIISTRSHAERGRQGRLERSHCFEWGHENKTPWTLCVRVGIIHCLCSQFKTQTETAVNKVILLNV